MSLFIQIIIKKDNGNYYQLSIKNSNHKEIKIINKIN